MTTTPTAGFDDLVPESLAPRSRRVLLEAFDVPVEICFHDFELGKTQRLLVTIEVWLDEASFASSDEVAAAWDYDFLRNGVLHLVAGRRFNLQETLVREIYALVAARKGVTALKVSTRKPDVYPDCSAVGIELASF